MTLQQIIYIKQTLLDIRPMNSKIQNCLEILNIEETKEREFQKSKARHRANIEIMKGEKHNEEENNIITGQVDAIGNPGVKINFKISSNTNFEINTLKNDNLWNLHQIK